MGQNVLVKIVHKIGFKNETWIPSDWWKVYRLVVVVVVVIYKCHWTLRQETHTHIHNLFRLSLHPLVMMLLRGGACSGNAVLRRILINTNKICPTMKTGLWLQTQGFKGKGYEGNLAVEVLEMWDILIFFFYDPLLVIPLNLFWGREGV